ncbi:MAG: response regulator transcription factor [Lachnospiraceae bacterium]|nr:response regulator transcription factor [Lachnospiraceae bacterium]MBD5540343.1 response regulator transcription factor [Lachnospiraceae bacterium]MBD5541927.1 response regulator transcription factor [Lachnospiraceae bacterium]
MKGIFQVGICDDKQEDLRLIEKAVRDSAKRIGISIPIKCFLFQDGEKMYEEMGKERFDLVLLDIEMPGMNGFQLAKRISMDRRTPCLIFISVHESFVFDAQTFMPLWFVRKSMLEKDMYKALQKYVELTTFKKACYELKGGSVYIRDIVYIECSGHLLTIQMADGKVIKQYGSLRVMEEELSKHHFLRIHKSYLVNPRYIEDIGRQEIRLTDGTMLEMGRDRRKALLQAIYKYEGENYGVR